MAEKQEMYRIGSLAGITAGIAAVLTGYTFQLLESYRLITQNSHLISGNLGDFGATLAMTCWYNRNEPENFTNQAVTATCLALYWSGFELLQKGQVIPGTYDTKDIVAYWLGSASAILISRLCTSDQVNNLFKREDISAVKKGLENIL